MYTLSRLKPASQSFVSGLSSSGATRTKAFEVALAYTIARSLPLPMEEVKDFDQYVALKFEHAIVEKLSMVNELLPFNTKSVRSLVRRFYQYRYQSAFPALIPLALRKDTGLEDFFNLSLIFDQDTLAVIKSEPATITTHVNGLRELMEVITPKQIMNDNTPSEKTVYVA